MDSNRLRSVCLSLALVALRGACTKKPEVGNREVDSQEINARDVGGQSVSKQQASESGADLPKECKEAEQAQRECTETMAAGYERVGHPEAAKKLRDSLKDLDAVRARWQAQPDKESLAKSCAMARDSLRAQPQCHR